MDRDELLLDFEPGLSAAVQARLEQYVIADDVQIVDVAPHYSLLSVQGPESPAVIHALDLGLHPLPAAGHSVQLTDPALGEICCAHLPRGATAGFDLFVPNATAEVAARRLLMAARKIGGAPAGWDALELVRVEAGVPRFGVDMDESTLAPEAGIEERAISYMKGCYIGQEVIARIRTYGQVAKALRGLRFAPEAQVLPKKGDKIYWSDKEIGYVTSSTASPTLKSNVALSYLRRERNQIGSEVLVDCQGERFPATVATLPFTPFVKE